MSSGYVTTNVPRRPDRVNPGKANPSVRWTTSTGVPYETNVNDYLWQNPITSFRSGPSFDRGFRTPGAVIGELNRAEVMASKGGDIGHEFSMRRVSEFYGHTVSKRLDSTMSPSWNTYTNPIPMFFTTIGGKGVDYSAFVDKTYSFCKTDSQLRTLGTSFVDSTNPIQSQVNLLSDIAEAISSGALLPEMIGKQIIGSVINPKKRSALIRSIGGEYLNFIFGFKPLADDIAKVGVLIDTVNGIVNQWIKDNATIVRRRRRVVSLPKNILDAEFDIPYGSLSGTQYGFLPAKNGQVDPTVVGFNWDSPTNRLLLAAKGFMVARVSSEITFSAGFEYDLTKLALPTGGSSAAEILHSSVLRKELEAIAFGLDPASIPRALYDATPFSWLLDWFVNIGEFFDNFRGLQSRGVQLKWGYITETVKRDCFFEYAVRWQPTGAICLTSNGFSAQKAIRRIRATPFGFGTTFGALTSSQVDILAALAAAKSPKIAKK